MRRVARAVGLVVVLLALGGAAVALWGYGRVRASLAVLEGEIELRGLVAPVRVERDALGVPVIRGQDRLDVARATGFVHGQERFFQMDLLRRRAAGELSELVGPAALEVDREVRTLRLRAVATRVVDALARDEHALLEAYAAGANGGLEALGAPPPEYLLLRATPRPWTPEDTLLSVLSMYLTLQSQLPGYESALGVMHDVLPPELFAFLTPAGTEWDAPLLGPPFAQPPVPGPEVLDLRTRPAPHVSRRGPTPAAPLDPLHLADAGEPVVYGSNNWAVAGSRTADGRALVANDMHLAHAMPNIWYRASLVFPGATGETRITGVTLPGTPLVVAGSNGHVAWGFTNSQGDWADLVVLESPPGEPESYLTPEGPRRLERTTETIHVKGGPDETLEVLSTVWGPVIDEDHEGRRRALAWVPLREGGLNIAALRMEESRDVEEALALAPEVGIPHQNLVCADSTGRIAWTLIGRIPRRVGFDGRLPTQWADGARRWDGWLRPEEYPRVLDPPDGLIWTANARTMEGEALDLLGFGNYALGARARQIRDDLRDVEGATEADMLRVQLDDRALFLERWRALLLETLEPAPSDPRLEEVRRLVEAWGGRAAIDSVGYRIVRAFRDRVSQKAFDPLLAPCREVDAGLEYTGRRPTEGHRQWEGPLWALVTERPPHLLDPRFGSWDELLLASLGEVLEELTADEAVLAERTWGEHNTVLFRHPLSQAAPALGRWLDIPPGPLPGDGNMPRVQYPTAGASERFAVSPGREGDGYFHMPGGQSGHPLSPHSRDGHEAWVRGDPSPFLPGAAEHVLTLQPSSASAPADRVFLGGKVWTGREEKPWAEALAVRGSRLEAVGSTAEVRRLVGDETEVVDLRGRLVTPGFIDAHLHLLDGGLSLETLRLDDAETQAAVMEALREWVEAHPDRPWVTGEGWSYSAFPDGLPSRTALDAVVGERPAWLVSYDGHTGWASSEALRLAGVTTSTPDPPDGTIVRDESGEATGVLKETAMALVADRVPKLGADEKTRAFTRALEQLAAWGVTSAHQAGIDGEDLALLAEVLEGPGARPRVYAALPLVREPTPQTLERDDALRRRYASPRLRVAAVKGYVDGVVETGTAAMFEPYPGGGRGLPGFTQDELDRAVAAYDREGWQVMLHAIGDRAIDMSLTAFERAARANETGDRRHRVEHIEVPRLADLPRFAAAGVIASTQALFALPGPNHYGAYVPMLGPERERRAMPFRSIDEAGAVQAFGSDWPVFTAEVLRGLQCAVTRASFEGTPVGGWLPEQRLDLEVALAHFTRDAAYAAHDEGDKGTLAPGKLADFVVLGEDVFTVAPGRIAEAGVLLTVIGGENAYRSEGF